MSEVSRLAKYFVYAYENYTSSHFESSELKLQKLLYFAQRESLALTGEVLFTEDIEGWVHGPVIPDIRFFFDNAYAAITQEELEKITDSEKYIIDNVLDQYAKYETWTLRNMTHDEYSWKESRKGLSDDQHGNQVLSVESIKIDAKNVRQYDHQWGMYIDEFEDDVEGPHVQ